MASKNLAKIFVISAFVLLIVSVGFLGFKLKNVEKSNQRCEKLSQGYGTFIKKINKQLNECYESVTKKCKYIVNNNECILPNKELLKANIFLTKSVNITSADSAVDGAISLQRYLRKKKICNCFAYFVLMNGKSNTIMNVPGVAVKLYNGTVMYVMIFKYGTTLIAYPGIFNLNSTLMRNWKIIKIDSCYGEMKSPMANVIRIVR